jgi:DNA-binding transcriptional MerR regulator
MKYVKGIPRSSLSRWQDEGLLDVNNEDNPKWRKFNLINLLWISIIEELRTFGFSLSNIKNVKEQLFASITLEDQQQYPLIEHSIMEALVYAIPSFLIIDKQGESTILDDKEYIGLLQAEKIVNHIVISINQSIKDNILHLYSKPIYTKSTVLSKQELKVLSAVREKNFQSIKIKKKSGEIDMIEGFETINTEQKIVDLLKSGKYQNIEVKQENGKIVCINRKMKIKMD